MKKERGYQTQCIDSVFKAMDKGVSKMILSLATGAGKTFVASRIASRFNRILFMSHTEELIDQSGVAMLNEFYPDFSISKMIEDSGGLIDYFRDNKDNGMFGIVKADMFNINGKITLASFQTIHRRLDRIPSDHFDLIIIDECHLSGAKTVVKTINHFAPKLLVGLTATPHRADGANLADIFDEITFQYGIANAIQDGYLVELDATQVKTQISLDKVRTTAGEFNYKDLVQTVDTPQRNKLIVESYKKYAEGKQNLIFCVDVQHAMNLCQAFKDAGYSAEFIVGDTELTPDRKAVIDRFKNGQTQILTNVMVLTAGFDHPGIGCLTMAAPTKSLTRFIQQIGRATRTLPGVIDGINTAEERIAAIKKSTKPHCVVLDVVDTSNRHKIVNTWTLDKDKPAEEKTFTTQEKREAMIVARKKREFEATTKADKSVNLFQLPLIKLSNSLKMKDPATVAQLSYLSALGYDTVSQNWTKGSANEALSNDPAPDNWVWVLKKAGYDVSNGVTRAEAKLAFTDMDERKKKAKEKKQMGNIAPIDGLF